MDIAYQYAVFLYTTCKKYTECTRYGGQILEGCSTLICSKKCIINTIPFRHLIKLRAVKI
jgi:hypothetical protein